MRELPTVDVLVVGGGVGGVAAALGAVDLGARVRLTEESPMLGGQLTSQATPPDEHPWIEHRGSTANYRRFRRRVRSTYGAAVGSRSPVRDPGSAWVTRLGHPPVIAEAAIRQMILPYLLRGVLEVHTGARPVSARTDSDRVAAVEFLSTDEGGFFAGASIVIDATESGDLLELAGVEHVTGSESGDITGEPHAERLARPDNLQAITVPFVASFDRRAEGPPTAPDHYDQWARFTPEGWPAPLLSWTAPDPRTGVARHYGIEGADAPGAGFDPGATVDLWTYRRVVDARRRPGLIEASSINWPMNDYIGGHLLGPDARHHADAARSLSASLLYWLQSTAPRPDGGRGYPALRARGDLTGTVDGFALRPYVREGRRIVAELTIAEQDVAVGDRGAAVEYPDAVGTGAYRIDLHPSTGGDAYLDIATHPFEIPLRALLPVRVENLLPGAKNIGTTHITNGCYRVHPAEWTIGEASGRLAAFSTERRIVPRAVSADPELQSEFQRLLDAAGFDRHWGTLKEEQL